METGRPVFSVGSGGSPLAATVLPNAVPSHGLFPTSHPARALPRPPPIELLNHRGLDLLVPSTPQSALPRHFPAARTPQRWTPVTEQLHVAWDISFLREEPSRVGRDPRGG